MSRPRHPRRIAISLRAGIPKRLEAFGDYTWIPFEYEALTQPVLLRFGRTAAGQLAITLCAEILS